MSTRIGRVVWIVKVRDRKMEGRIASFVTFFDEHISKVLACFYHHGCIWRATLDSKMEAIVTFTRSCS